MIKTDFLKGINLVDVSDVIYQRRIDRVSGLITTNPNNYYQISQITPINAGDKLYINNYEKKLVEFLFKIC